MSEVTTEQRSTGLRNLAIVLASLIIAVPIAVGRLVEAILDSSNPANVDVTQPLAYLREILAWGFGMLGVLFVVIIIVLVLLYRRTRSVAALGLPMLIAALQIVIGLVTLWLSGMADGGNG